MWRSLSPRWKRLVSSLAVSALVVVVIGLGYLTFQAVSNRRQRMPNGAEAVIEPGSGPLLEVGSFSTRQEKSSDGERLSISLRMRLTAPGTVDCYVYVLARNDHVSPKLWAVWPPQGTGGAITAGGHLRTQNPTTGEEVSLTTSWTRVTATLDHPPGHPPFETVLLYVVSREGEILLVRPFAL